MRSTNVGKLVLALVLLSATASTVSAQSNYWEIGTDAALTVRLEDPNYVLLRIPGGQIRAGYFTTPTISIEPTFSWLSIGQENTEGFSAYSIGAGVLFHRGADRNRSRVYLRPFLAVHGGSGGGSDMSLGGGVGVKRPLFGGRGNWRGEVNLEYNDAGPGALYLNGLLGLSIYTR